MPFSDELTGAVRVLDYDGTWPEEFRSLATRLAGALGPLAPRIDHIGSTSVPGMAAKDCVDVQVCVDDLGDPAIGDALTGIGFRVRPEPWNRVETSGGRSWPKLVFAPPPGERAVNVHVRTVGSATARRNLLFRDYLSADPAARDAWSRFKRRLAETATELADYGQIKQPVTEVLMLAAEE